MERCEEQQSAEEYDEAPVDARIHDDRPCTERANLPGDPSTPLKVIPELVEGTRLVLRSSSMYSAIPGS